MPRIRHRRENSPSTYRGRGIRTEPGDEVDVSDETAAALCRRPYFERVETDDSDECPFCDAYEGENVAQHASQAHPDEWADYSED